MKVLIKNNNILIRLSFRYNLIIYLFYECNYKKNSCK